MGKGSANPGVQASRLKDLNIELNESFDTSDIPSPHILIRPYNCQVKKSRV